MKQRLCALAVLAVLSAPAVADEYMIDPVFTVPSFEIKHLGFSTQIGRFNKVAGTVTFDPVAKKGSVDLTIYAASLDIGTPAWAAHLMSEGLFNVQKFPTMRFRSQELVFDGDKVVAANGEFTMIGVTRPLRISLSGFQCRNIAEQQRTVCGADATANMKRSDFGLLKYVADVSDEILIRVPIEAYRK